MQQKTWGGRPFAVLLICYCFCCIYVHGMLATYLFVCPAWNSCLFSGFSVEGIHQWLHSLFLSNKMKKLRPILCSFSLWWYICLPINWWTSTCEGLELWNFKLFYFSCLESNCGIHPCPDNFVKPWMDVSHGSITAMILFFKHMLPYAPSWGLDDIAN
jgi:hypothetical protein